MFPTDCHFHVFAARHAMSGTRYVPEYDATLANWSVASRAVGIARGVVVQPSFLGDDHSQLLAALAAQTDALRGVAAVGPEVSAETLAELYRAGVRGVRLNLFGATDDVAALRALPVRWWDAIAAQGFHIELHTNIGRVAALAPHMPHEITLVLDHFGKPESVRTGDATLRAVAARSGNTWVKLSAAYRQAPDVARHALAECWLDTLGPDALLWGSDWPCTNFEAIGQYAALYEALDVWITNAEVRTQIFCDNAQRLYWR
jgi:predicted TIM-barrel fold metal-dependent hydrolase